MQEIDARWKQEVSIIPFLENRKTHSNLNESQASNSMRSEPEDQFKRSKAEGTPGQSQRHIDVEAGKKRGDQDNIANGGKASDAEIADAEKRYKEMKQSQKNIRKQRTDTPAQEMIQILKENPSLRKTSKKLKIPSVSETMDETDMFFLSMAKMTKQLPKVEQARIKLALSNSMLSAEIKCTEQLFVSLHNNTPPPNTILHRSSRICHLH